MTWPKVKLGDVITANYGKALKAQDRDASGEYDVFGSNGYVGKHSSTLISDPTIVIGRKGSVGAITYAPYGGWTIDTAYYVTPKRETDLRFLFYALQNADLEGLAITTSIPGLNRDSLYRVEIPLPPLEEQKRLAAILDRADELRRVRRSTLERLDELAQSLFLELFGDPATNPKSWDVVKLGDVCGELQNGIGKGKDFYGRGAKVANIGDLYESATFKPEKYSLLEVSPKEIEKYRLYRGDVLFVRSSVKREGVAYCSAYDSDEECLFSSFMIRARPDAAKLVPLFFAFALRLPSAREQLINSSNTSTLTNISQEGINRVTMPLPPLALQQQFAEQIEELETIKSRARASLTEIDALFASLQARAFAGELCGAA